MWVDVLKPSISNLALVCRVCLMVFGVSLFFAQPGKAQTADLDLDGIPNVIETSVGLNPASASDANLDLDGDGWSNLDEYRFGSGIDNASIHPANTQIEVNAHQKGFGGDSGAGDRLGFGVDVEGATALIGARFDDSTGMDSGVVYVFTQTSDLWTQQAKLVANDASAGDLFGYAVSLSGETALVSAVGDSGAGAGSGSAYVFTRSGTVWTRQAKLVASDSAAGDRFGVSVSLAGETVLIGANLDDDGASASGSAYVFVRSGTVWTEQAKLVASDAGEDDEFGISVALDGDTALVGAFLDDDTAVDSGSAYVFTRSGGAWTEQAKLVADDPEDSELFGVSVALDAETALVGAQFDDSVSLTLDVGSVYVFVRTGISWTQQDKLYATDPATDDNFGFALSLSGDRALVGAHGNEAALTDAGAAYLFIRSGTTWTQRLKFRV